MGKRLRSGVGELLVIVLGVLIALGVDSWRSGLQDRASEADYLASLLHDLRTDSLEYEAVSTVLRRAQFYTGQTLALTSPGPAATNNLQGAAASLFCASFLPIPVVSRETLEDLLATGTLQLLRNRNLRTAFLRYHARADSELQWVDEYRSNQQHYRELLAQLRVPELQARSGGVSGMTVLTEAEGIELVRGLAGMSGSVAALNRMLFAQQRMQLHLAVLSAGAFDLIPKVTQELQLLTERHPMAAVTESPSSHLIDSGICPEPTNSAL